MSLLNLAAFKRYTMEQARLQRGPRFTQMSPDFANRMEAVLKQAVNNEIHRLPSVGKTIR